MKILKPQFCDPDKKKESSVILFLMQNEYSLRKIVVRCTAIVHLLSRALIKNTINKCKNTHFIKDNSHIHQDRERKKCLKC